MYKRIGIFLLVFVFTFILRAHNFDRIPVSGHLEEQMYAWQGLYLIETGTPEAWSSLPYPDSAEVSRGQIDYKGGDPVVHVRMYRPWLDQPPLFGLISGGFAHLYKADKTQVVPNSYIRTPAIIFATLTSILVFLIARSVSGYWTGILAMLLYGTIPIFVFASRLSVAENLITLLFALLVYLAIQYEKKAQFMWIAIMPLLAGLAGLAKPTGFFIIFFAVFFALKKHNLKHAIYLILMTLPFVGMFFLYGKYYDWEIFQLITTVQSSRPVGFASLAWFFVSPAYDIFTLTDPWYIFCLLASAFYIFNSHQDSKYIVSLAFIFWLFVVMVSGGEGDLLPWYRFPAFPYLAIAGAWGLQYVFRKADLFTSLLSIGLFLGSRSFLINDFRSNLYPMQLRFILLGLAAPALLNHIYNKKIFLNLSKCVIVGVITVGMYFNVVYIYNQYELTCENKTCPLLPSTSLSSIHFPIIWRMFVLGTAFRHD